MDLLQFPVELLFEQLKYIPADGIRKLYMVSRSGANLIANFLGAQRNAIKYCILNYECNDKEPLYSQLDTLFGSK